MVVLYYLNNTFVTFIATALIDSSDLEFEKKVGEGGSGTVYKGKWLSRRLVVAIKTTGEIKKMEVSAVQYYCVT